METPQLFFNRLNEVFHFTLDPCADEQNHKCSLYYTQQNNGLTKNWMGQVVFCNPPYSRKTKTKCGQEDFIHKCLTEWREHHVTSVLLIPARTDTKAQHEYIFPYAKYLCFVRGRLKFGGLDSGAPFPSELAVFTDQNFDQELETLSDLGKWIKLNNMR